MSGGLLPTDVGNQALDAIGFPFTMGDLQEGTRPAQILLRAYYQCLVQLLRAAPWDCARKQAPLVLLADATGNTANVGTVVPVPWVYEYAYPEDCARARFVPYNWQNQANTIPAGNIATPSTPQTTVGNTQAPWGKMMVARFLVASDYNYPPQVGSQPWATPNVSPQGRTVVLTNVQNATLVYTAIMDYPSNWDAAFRAAFVAYLASEVALPLWVEKDRKFGLMVRDEQIGIVKAKVSDARAASANEGGPPTSDISVDWMRTRMSGGPALNNVWGANGAYDGVGVMGYGWDGLALAGGAVF